MTSHDTHGQSSFWKSRTGIALCAFFAIASVLLILEHRAHALQWLLLAQFGEEYRRYKEAVPAFLPRFGVSTLTFPRWEG